MKKIAILLFLGILAMVLYACGGSTISESGATGGSGTGNSNGAGGGDAGMSDSGGDAGQSFTISGTVSGLAGTGLTLANGSETIAVNTNGAFAFKTPVAAGSTYDVTVATEPSMPAQNCTVANASGTVTANVSNVTVICADSTFTIGGTLTGLAGDMVVLQDNGGDNLTLAANGSFTFATQIATGAAFDVTVLTEPESPSQTCTVTMGTGTVGSADVTSVSVACATNSYTIGGTVSGLAGTGLVLQDNGGDNLAVAADGTFTFATPVASGGAYAVTLLTQPTSPTQVCAVTMGTGTVADADVTDVAVTCTTTTFTLGGTLTGLAAGDSVVLQDNGADNLTVSANGTFTFATPVASGATFAVTVLTEPGAPAQSCAVSGGTGTVGAGNVTSVTVNCTTNAYTVGGTVTGLAGTLVLQDNGADNLTLTMNGTFAFATPIASGGTYGVTVLTQPGSPVQTCVVTNGAGTVGAANVTSVTITCTTSTYAVGGTLSGLAAGDSVVLQDDGASNLTVSANGAFTFATPIPSGGAYAVTVLTNPQSPIAQTCVVTSGSGTVINAGITSVVVTCTTNDYTVGGTISGLTGTVVLVDNGTPLTLSANGGFTFGTPLASGVAYAVTVQTQSPSASCVVTNGTGTITNFNVTSVTVTCTACGYTTNVALTGTASVSSGGNVAPYLPSDANDGIVEATTCSDWAWVQAGNTPGGLQWIQYTWTAAQNVTKIHMDTCSGTVTDACGNLGRTLGAAQIQWWNGSAWVTDGTVTGQLDDWSYTFTTQITTTQVRLYDVYATNTQGQTSNPMVFEWQVYSCH